MTEKKVYDQKKKPRVINLGIEIFYEALLIQDVKCAQIEWQPPVKQSKEIEALLDKFL